jgi:hypothetical protein
MCVHLQRWAAKIPWRSLTALTVDAIFSATRRATATATARIQTSQTSLMTTSSGLVVGIPDAKY